MRALLTLYLISQLGFQDAQAYTIYSLFAAIGYAVPVLAGVLADRLLGFQRILILAGFILCLGHLALAFSFDQHAFVYFGLALITIGAGFFKGNATSLLGTLYTPLESARESEFTWFYVAVNGGGTNSSYSLWIRSQSIRVALWFWFSRCRGLECSFS